MVTSVLQHQQYMFGVRSLLVDEKVLLMKKDLADVYCVVSTTDPAIEAVASLIRSDWRVINKCSNKFGQYVEK